MARREPHIYDQVAEELTAWLTEEPEILAEMITGGGPSPFSAQISEADKLAYYKKQFFLPDGTPNQEGRSQVLNRVGIDGYTQIWHALTRPYLDEPSESSDESHSPDIPTYNY